MVIYTAKPLKMPQKLSNFIHTYRNTNLVLSVHKKGSTLRKILEQDLLLTRFHYTAKKTFRDIFKTFDESFLIVIIMLFKGLFSSKI